MPPHWQDVVMFYGDRSNQVDSMSSGYSPDALCTLGDCFAVLVVHRTSLSKQCSFDSLVQFWVSSIQVRGWWPVRLACAQSSLFGFLFWRAAGLRQLRFATSLPRPTIVSVLTVIFFFGTFWSFLVTTRMSARKCFAINECVWHYSSLFI